jgi:PAS domain S-box-containing protein
MKIHTLALPILGLVITSIVSAQQEPLPFIPETNMTACTVNYQSEATATASTVQQAKDFFSSLLNVSSWPPRWQCGVWTPFHGWLYIISDAAIGASYFLIPLILLFFLKKQRLQKAFRLVVLLFVVFILGCGLTHIIDALTFWWPAYRLSALVRFATAIVSAGTVLTLVKITPTVLNLKSPDSMEKLVTERAKELVETTKKLQEEIETRKQVERALAKSENQYRSLFESAAVGHMVADKEGTIIMTNDRMNQLFGYQKNSLAGQKVETLIPEAIREKHIEHRNAYSRHPKLRNMSEGMEFLARKNDGSTFPVEISLNYNHFEDDLMISALVIDISQRKNTERKLAESEKYFRSIIENISDAIVVNDEDYKLLYQSPSVKRITGYTEEERKGLSIEKYVHPDHLEDFKKIYKTVKERPNEPIPFQYQFLHKNGHYIWIEGVVTNLLNEESVRAIVANYRDITDRKKSEAEIIKLQKKDEANATQMSTILDALPVSIALINEHGIIVDVNKSWKDFGRANGLAGAHHAIGDNYLSVAKRSVGPDRELAIKVAKAIEDVLAGNILSYTTEYPCHSPVDNRWFRMIATPLRKTGSGAVVMHLNITEQRKSERQLRLSYEALENSMNAFEIVNREGKHIYVNQAYLTMWGFGSRDEVLGTSPSGRSVDPELPSKIMAILIEKKRCKMEYTAKRKDGSTFEALMTGILSADEDGNAIFIASAIDITDRKINEEKLKQERTLLRTLIDNLPDYIYVKDTHLRFLINNKADLNLMNVTSEAMTIGKTAIEIFGPEIAQPFHDDDQRVMLSDKPLVDREEMVVNNNGEKKFLLTTKVPLRDSQSNVTGLVSIRRDVTKQKQIELDLRNSNYFLETAQAVGKMGHWVSEIGKEGKLHWSNETCRIFGIGPEEFDGRNETFFEFVHPDDLASLNEATAIAYEGRNTYSIDHRIILRNGSIKWVHEQGEASYDEHGKAYRLIGIIQDITEHKETQNEILQLNAELEARVAIRTEQLQAANKEMEAFSYSVSHDLRAPLRIIDGFSQILVEDYVDKLDVDGKKTLDTIMSNAKRMGQLIDDLLNLSRIGRVEIRKAKVDMNRLVREVLQELKLGGVQIPEQLRIDRLAPMHCDENLLRHVWINLLSNAIKYSSAKETPVIEVGMKDKNGRSTYYVKDNGAGFDMRYYHKLFGVFQRLHGHQEFSGTGVGLAIVQRIIVRHGGSVWAESKVNEGTTFYFFI